MDYTVGWGLRPDNTEKGNGFAWSRLPNNEVVTELSAGPDNKLYPLVYEGITPWDMQTVRNVAMYGYDPLIDEVNKRAYTQSLIREMRGLAPFATLLEQLNSGVPYTPIHWK